MYELGKDQTKAFDLIKEFLDSSEKVFSLIGSAGTGKTKLIEHIIKYAESINKHYILCAPTHKAKLVIEKMTQREGLTLHKLLALAPNIEILELDFKDLKFYMNDSKSLFPTNGLIICDESSMINDDMFDLLNEKCKNHRSKIIFVGDSQQLKPVNSEKLSKVFTCENKFELMEIFRQKNDSGLVDVLPILRERSIDRFETCEGLTGSVYCYDTPKDFILSAMPYFKQAMEEQDILKCKILSYTNSRVDKFNDKVKELLFGNNLPYNKFQFLSGAENFEYNKFKIWNSMDYIIVDDPQRIELNIPNFAKLPAYRLTLYDASSKLTFDVCILDDNINQNYYTALALKIENLRIDAINAKGKSNASLLWKEYFKLINSFASPRDLYYENRLIKKKSFSNGYATTIHKSQGSTIDHVFVDAQSINLCRNNEEIRQLQYVALSRTKQNVYIFQ